MSYLLHTSLRSLSRGLNRLAEPITRRSSTLFGYSAFFFSVLLSQVYLFELSTSSGPSMFPTIPDVANLLFVNKTYRRGKGIQVGDCIMFSNPLIPKEYSGKRVIGLPGDYVLRSKQQSPAPGGAPVPGITDWRRRLKRAQQQEWEEPEMIQVPEGHVWVEGDNLAWSRDSRTYGPVPMALIKGRSSWFAEGFLSSTSLKPGKGLRRVEEWEMDARLGEEWLRSKEKEHLESGES